MSDYLHRAMGKVDPDFFPHSKSRNQAERNWKWSSWTKKTWRRVARHRLKQQDKTQYQGE